MSKNIVVLVEPEIPSNTGNVARTCVVTHTALQLVGPLGFSLENKYLKRAGLDYWDELDLQVWENLEVFQEYLENRVKAGFLPIYATTKADQNLRSLVATQPTIMLFGKETAGLPEDFLHRHPERCYRIPMYRDERCLNLANSANILLYEVLRQQGYPDLH